MRNNIMVVCISTALLLFCSCKESRLKLPASDATPPVGKWIVTDIEDSSNLVTKEFTESYNEWDVSPHHKVNVVFSVEDIDGGVKKLAISGGGLTACPLSLQDDIAEITVSPDTMLLKPEKNKYVQSLATKSVLLDMACQRKTGDVFPQIARGPGGNIELNGYGENHHGGTVTSKLVIKTSVE